MTKPYTMTVREFKDRIVDQIKNLPDDSEIFFGAGDLSFYRVKNRGYIGDSDTPRLVQNQLGANHWQGRSGAE
ncbi:hypothetical protein [Burkholderia pseudomallei]|uniref:hypothetical protein n=1 Tax=Burkholderia pseudomallei TaxID=28450 RepID=UPI0011AB7782|nr:hypothetical protein [Burkholderia pseudomallei]